MNPVVENGLAAIATRREQRSIEETTGRIGKNQYNNEVIQAIFHYRMKTNKSFTKRLKRTRTGKLIARKSGGNHFNAKESRSVQLARKRPQPFALSQRMRRRFIP